MYSHFMSFLHIVMTQVVEICPQVRQGPAYSTVSIMAADDLVGDARSQGISNHDIYHVEPD